MFINTTARPSHQHYLTGQRWTVEWTGNCEGREMAVMPPAYSVEGKLNVYLLTSTKIQNLQNLVWHYDNATTISYIILKLTYYITVYFRCYIRRNDMMVQVLILNIFHLIPRMFWPVHINCQGLYNYILQTVYSYNKVKYVHVFHIKYGDFTFLYFRKIYSLFLLILNCNGGFTIVSFFIISASSC
jgi:hypothetical protein